MDVGDVCKKATALQTLNLRACRRCIDVCVCCSVLQCVAARTANAHFKGLPQVLRCACVCVFVRMHVRSCVRVRACVHTRAILRACAVVCARLRACGCASSE